MIQLLTATGARPAAFAICEALMAAQTYAGPVTWIVVDDGPQPTPINKSPKGWLQVVVRPTPFWQKGQNTQARNLLSGLNTIDPAHPLLIIEDDDCYAPDWIDTCVRELARAELVGEVRARYYNVNLRMGRQLNNGEHASLCATAMRGPAISTFRAACELSPKYIDLELWRQHRSRHLFGGHRVVGIKGLPGRGGIGMGHRSDFRGDYDPDGSLLRQWTGDNAKHYL